MEKHVGKSGALQRHESGQVERVQQRPTVSPRVDVYENDHELLLVADMPGLENDHLRIHLDKEQLTIEGARHEEKRGAMLSEEFRDVDYQRTFLVPPGIDVNKIEADFKQGVLYLRLPKSEEIRPRQIVVKGG